MSRTKKICILVICWIVASIGTILLINKYISDKDSRLLKEIRQQVADVFEGQDDGSNFITFDYGLFDSPMNGGVVKNFTRTTIPSKPQNKKLSELDSLYGFHSNVIDEWNESYGDVASLWNLNWGSDKFNEREDAGWEIVGIRFSGVNDACIHTFTLFPYQVALKKSEWGNYYTVPQAVQEAFDFYTTNPKSGISDRYERGSHKRIWNKLYDSQNEYYGIYKNENHNNTYVGKMIPCGARPEEGGPIQNGWMHNGYYRVYVAATQGIYHGIQKHPWSPDIKDRNKLLIIWLSVILLLFWIPITVLLVRKRKESKRHDETLKERLLRVCSPANYMSNYDKEKVSIANTLYQEIMSSDNESQLLEIANKAQKELSVSLIEKSELEEIKLRVNPARFMKPYDAQKVALANELFSMLDGPDLTYSDFITVRERSKSL